MSHVTVGKWRRRYHDRGIGGLEDEQRPGRPRSYDDKRVAEVLNRALQSRPANASHWSVRSLSEATGIPKSTVHRWLQECGLQPHWQRYFKISNDPLFEGNLEKLPHSHPGKACGLMQTLVTTGFVLMGRHLVLEA